MSFSPTDFECPKCHSDALNVRPFVWTESGKRVRVRCLRCSHVWTISEQPDVPPTLPPIKN
jgi:uncharacterized Zn finger protein